MAKNKLSLSSNIADLAEQFDKLGGDLKKITEKALKASHAKITPNIKNDIARHHRTGRTERSLITKANVEWSGTTATVGVGFDIDNGGIASIFLMYGTPRMKKDTKLYNDLYGSKARKEVEKVQSEIFESEIRKRMGG